MSLMILATIFAWAPLDPNAEPAVDSNDGDSLFWLNGSSLVAMVLGLELMVFGGNFFTASRMTVGFLVGGSCGYVLNAFHWAFPSPLLEDTLAGVVASGVVLAGLCLLLHRFSQALMFTLFFYISFLTVNAALQWAQAPCIADLTTGLEAPTIACACAGLFLTIFIQWYPKYTILRLWSPIVCSAVIGAFVFVLSSLYLRHPHPFSTGLLPLDRFQEWSTNGTPASMNLRSKHHDAPFTHEPSVLAFSAPWCGRSNAIHCGLTFALFLTLSVLSIILQSKYTNVNATRGDDARSMGPPMAYAATNERRTRGTGTSSGGRMEESRNNGSIRSIRSMLSHSSNAHAGCITNKCIHGASRFEAKTPLLLSSVSESDADEEADEEEAIISSLAARGGGGRRELQQPMLIKPRGTTAGEGVSMKNNGYPFYDNDNSGKCHFMLTPGASSTNTDGDTGGSSSSTNDPSLRDDDIISSKSSNNGTDRNQHQQDKCRGINSINNNNSMMSHSPMMMCDDRGYDLEPQRRRFPRSRTPNQCSGFHTWKPEPDPWSSHVYVACSLGITVMVAVLIVFTLDWRTSYVLPTVLFLMCSCFLVWNITDFLLVSVSYHLIRLSTGFPERKREHFPKGLPDTHRTFLAYMVLASDEETVSETFEHAMDALYTNLCPRGNIWAGVVSASSKTNVLHAERVARDVVRRALGDRIVEEGTKWLEFKKKQCMAQRDGSEYPTPNDLRSMKEGEDGEELMWRPEYWETVLGHLIPPAFPEDAINGVPQECTAPTTPSYSLSRYESTLVPALKAHAVSQSERFVYLHRTCKVLKKAGQYQDLMLLTHLGVCDAFSYCDDRYAPSHRREEGDAMFGFHNNSECAMLRDAQCEEVMARDIERLSAIGQGENPFRYTMVMDKDTELFTDRGVIRLVEIASANPEYGIFQPALRVSCAPEKAPKKHHSRYISPDMNTNTWHHQALSKMEASREAGGGVVKKSGKPEESMKTEDISHHQHHALVSSVNPVDMVDDTRIPSSSSSSSCNSSPPASSYTTGCGGEKYQVNDDYGDDDDNGTHHLFDCSTHASQKYTDEHINVHRGQHVKDMEMCQSGGGADDDIECGAGTGIPGGARITYAPSSTGDEGAHQVIPIPPHVNSPPDAVPQQPSVKDVEMCLSGGGAGDDIECGTGAGIPGVRKSAPSSSVEVIPLPPRVNGPHDVRPHTTVGGRGRGTEVCAEGGSNDGGSNDGNGKTWWQALDHRQPTWHMWLESVRQITLADVSFAASTIFGRYGFYGKGLIDNEMYVRWVIGDSSRTLVELLPADILSHDTIEAKTLRPLYCPNIVLAEEPARNPISAFQQSTRWMLGEIRNATYGPGSFRSLMTLLRFFCGPRRVSTAPPSTNSTYGTVNAANTTTTTTTANTTTTVNTTTTANPLWIRTRDIPCSLGTQYISQHALRLMHAGPCCFLVMLLRHIGLTTHSLSFKPHLERYLLLFTLVGLLLAPKGMMVLDLLPDGVFGRMWCAWKSGTSADTRSSRCVRSNIRAELRTIGQKFVLALIEGFTSVLIFGPECIQGIRKSSKAYYSHITNVSKWKPQDEVEREVKMNFGWPMIFGHAKYVLAVGLLGFVYLNYFHISDPFSLILLSSWLVSPLIIYVSALPITKKQQEWRIIKWADEIRGMNKEKKTMSADAHGRRVSARELLL